MITDGMMITGVAILAFMWGILFAVTGMVMIQMGRIKLPQLSPYEPWEAQKPIIDEMLERARRP